MLWVHWDGISVVLILDQDIRLGNMSCICFLKCVDYFHDHGVGLCVYWFKRNTFLLLLTVIQFSLAFLDVICLVLYGLPFTTATLHIEVSGLISFSFRKGRMEYRISFCPIKSEKRGQALNYAALSYLIFSVHFVGYFCEMSLKCKIFKHD